MKSYPIKTEYYESFSCDFAGNDQAAPKISSDYRYKRESFLFKCTRFLLYRCLATPFAFIYSRLILGDRIYGKQKLKSVKGSGFFIYGNHTRDMADAFTPSVAAFPKRVSVVISPKNLALPIIGKALPYLGGIPTPSSIRAYKDFSSEVTDRAMRGEAVMIYPEAHLWPYMTALRPFGEESFTYQAKTGLPAFTLTRVYKKTKRGYRCELYIDGPIFPDMSVSKKEAAMGICAAVRSAMDMRCGLSDIEVVKYEASL